MNIKENIFSSIVSSKIINPVNNEKLGKDLKWKADLAPRAQEQYFPMYFSLSENGENWLLPYEPILTINGKNNIIKRYVSKAKTPIKGAIKEYWSQDDYEITITGFLRGDFETGNVKKCFPISDFIRLKDFLSEYPVIWVYCEPLSILGINRITIEGFSFPFTKGENVQSYEIKAVSDFDYTLITKLKETGK